MSISKNLSDIQAIINKNAQEHGRDPSQVSLVAVSKRQSDAAIRDALDSGHRIFGENRVQEAQAHWMMHRQSGNYTDLILHLIGPLQTNKVKDAVALFDVIETLDREKLARALGKEMQKQERQLPCFIQVNTGEEAQKSGVYPSDLEEFYAFCVRECGLDVTGLMCIPPIDEPAAMHFGLLNRLTHNLGLTHLSMGMSADYPKAVALGATYIRVGTGIFGVRSDTN